MQEERRVSTYKQYLDAFFRNINWTVAAERLDNALSA